MVVFRINYQLHLGSLLNEDNFALQGHLVVRVDSS